MGPGRSPRQLVAHMLRRLPESRATAAEYLGACTGPGRLFPPAFRDVLHPLMASAVSHPGLQDPDARVLLLARAFPRLLLELAEAVDEAGQVAIAGILQDQDEELDRQGRSSLQQQGGMSWAPPDDTEWWWDVDVHEDWTECTADSSEVKQHDQTKGPLDAWVGPERTREVPLSVGLGRTGTAIDLYSQRPVHEANLAARHSMRQVTGGGSDKSSSTIPVPQSPSNVSISDLLAMVDAELAAGIGSHVDCEPVDVAGRSGSSLAEPSDIEGTETRTKCYLNGEMLALVLPLLTSSMRHVSSARLRLLSVMLLARLSCVPGISQTFLLRSSLPYLVEAARDESAMVRTHALAAVACLSLTLRSSAQEDTYVVPHYVLEGVAHCQDDPCAVVRECYAAARPMLLLAARAIAESAASGAAAIALSSAEETGESVSAGRQSRAPDLDVQHLMRSLAI